MKAHWKAAGFALGLVALAPSAKAHELACEKTVNDEAFLNVTSYPVTLTYELKVINVHPTAPSEALEASDPLLEGLGFGGFSVPFTLPLGDNKTKTFDVEVGSYKDCMKLAAEDGMADEFIDNAFTVRWDSGSQVCSARVKCEEEKNGCDDGKRMTGGGSLGKGDDRVTHGFQLRCDPTDTRQNLEINWGTPKDTHRFKLETLTDAQCVDTALDEGNPVAGFDTFAGEGKGSYDGVSGATIVFSFADAGEPGKDDEMIVLIKDKDGNVVLDESGKLTFGNHQAHP